MNNSPSLAFLQMRMTGDPVAADADDAAGLDGADAEASAVPTPLAASATAASPTAGRTIRFLTVLLPPCWPGSMPGSADETSGEGRDGPVITPGNYPDAKSRK
jgi:hypothetical protein